MSEPRKHLNNPTVTQYNELVNHLKNRRLTFSNLPRFQIVRHREKPTRISISYSTGLSTEDSDAITIDFFMSEKVKSMDAYRNLLYNGWADVEVMGDIISAANNLIGSEYFI